MRKTAWALAVAFACLPAGVNAQITSAPHGLDREIHPRRIAGDADRVWFTDERFTPHSVGFFSTRTGHVTTFAVPCDGCSDGSRITYIEDIAIAPDGSGWFIYTEVRSDGAPLDGGNNNYIGRMSESGEFSKFRVPTVDAFRRYLFPQNYSSITAAADGMWFTENAPSKVGRITWSGAITEYALPASSSPSDITAGPDGNVWFTLTGKGQVGRARIGPRVAEETNVPLDFFTLPANSPVRSPLSVVATEKSLFVFDQRQRMVTELSPAGSVVREFPVPGGGSPGFATSLVDVVAPRSGVIYYCDWGRHAFGRFYEDVPLDTVESPLPADITCHDLTVTRSGLETDVWMAGINGEFHDTILRHKDKLRGKRSANRRRSAGGGTPPLQP